MCSLFYKGNFKLLMKLVYAHEELLWGRKSEDEFKKIIKD